MDKRIIVGLTAAAALAATAVSVGAQESARPDPKMSFFITSVGSGDGGNLGGLAGADRHCQALATAVGAGGKTWKAYLSADAAGGQPAVNARDRIGSGPWFNAKGVQIASNIADLHSENAKTGKEGSLTEKGAMVNGRGDTPNEHDILTGSNMDGTLTAGMTCNNWTSNAETGGASAGHHDRQGGGANPTSWNSAHPTRGCAQANLLATGGAGKFYCFATN
jgi:hypothetical protein